MKASGSVPREGKEEKMTYFDLLFWYLHLCSSGLLCKILLYSEAVCYKDHETGEYKDRCPSIPSGKL